MKKCKRRCVNSEKRERGHDARIVPKFVSTFQHNIAFHTVLEDGFTSSWRCLILLEHSHCPPPTTRTSLSPAARNAEFENRRDCDIMYYAICSRRRLKQIGDRHERNIFKPDADSSPLPNDRRGSLLQLRIANEHQRLQSSSSKSPSPDADHALQKKRSRRPAIIADESNSRYERNLPFHVLPSTTASRIRKHIQNTVRHPTIPTNFRPPDSAKIEIPPLRVHHPSDHADHNPPIFPT